MRYPAVIIDFMRHKIRQLSDRYGKLRDTLKRIAYCPRTCLVGSPQVSHLSGRSKDFLLAEWDVQSAYFLQFEVYMLMRTIF